MKKKYLFGLLMLCIILGCSKEVIVENKETIKVEGREMKMNGYLTIGSNNSDEPYLLRMVSITSNNTLVLEYDVTQLSGGDVPPNNATFKNYVTLKANEDKKCLVSTKCAVCESICFSTHINNGVIQLEYIVDKENKATS